MSGVFDGQQEANYRERSCNASMAGVQMGATFRCTRCKQAKPAMGRKPMVKGYSKAGYKCADCVGKVKANG